MPDDLVGDDSMLETMFLHCASNRSASNRFHIGQRWALDVEVEHPSVEIESGARTSSRWKIDILTVTFQWLGDFFEYLWCISVLMLFVKFEKVCVLWQLRLVNFNNVRI